MKAEHSSIDVANIWRTGERRHVRSILVGALGLVRRRPLGAVALILLLLIVGLSMLAPVIAPYDVAEINAYERLQSPNSTYIMGTDALGRDQFSRVLFGTRNDLIVCSIGVLIGIVAGTVLGLATGYLAGGWLDLGLQRLIDVQMTVPPLVLAIAIITAINPGTTAIVVVISLLLLPSTARVLRGAAIAERNRAYVEAAQAIGCSNIRTMFRHVLPNMFGPLMVLVSLALGNALLIEGGLSFLGYGPPPPTPTLGLMLSGDNRNAFRSAWWLALFPGLVMALAIFAFNTLGDVLRDAFDPRLRGARS
ncbi:MAG: ABC transporter permease [Dehalococcoidia bacterium]